MRRRKDIKISRTNSIKDKVEVQPMNISSFMFLSMITLMMFTVASFVMYTFPYLMYDEQLQSVPEKGNSDYLSSKGVDSNEMSKENGKHFQHSPLRKSYSLKPEQVLEERNAAMKKYSYPYNLNGVDKRSLLSIQEFKDVYDGKWPVIITDVVEKWPAFNWTKEFFTEKYGDSKVAMQGVHESRKETIALPLKHYLSHLDDSSESSWTYLQDELFLLQRSELKNQVLDSIYTEENYFRLFPKEVQPWDCMLLWGTAHSRSTLHIDPYNWTGTNAVISGKKLWKLVPPGQDHLLSIKDNANCGFPLECQKYNSIIDAYNPKNDKEQEQISKVRFLEVEQNAGEMLFIPTGWFHQAYNAVPTLAISGQLMNENNYKVVLQEIFKGGSLSWKDLPKQNGNMSPRDLVTYISSVVPLKVIEKGAAITKEALDEILINKKMNQMKSNS